MLESIEKLSVLVGQNLLITLLSSLVIATMLFLFRYFVGLIKGAKETGQNFSQDVIERFKGNYYDNQLLNAVVAFTRGMLGLARLFLIYIPPIAVLYVGFVILVGLVSGGNSNGADLKLEVLLIPIVCSTILVLIKPVRGYILHFLSGITIWFCGVLFFFVFFNVSYNFIAGPVIAYLVSAQQEIAFRVALESCVTGDTGVRIDGCSPSTVWWNIGLSFLISYVLAYAGGLWWKTTTEDHLLEYYDII